jgi:YD repeat-containing protein
VRDPRSADVYTLYDLAGRRLSSRFVSAGGDGIIYAYDAAGRLLSEQSTIGTTRTLSFQCDSTSDDPDESPTIEFGAFKTGRYGVGVDRGATVGGQYTGGDSDDCFGNSVNSRSRRKDQECVARGSDKLAGSKPSWQLKCGRARELDMNRHGNFWEQRTWGPFVLGVFCAVVVLLLALLFR